MLWLFVLHLARAQCTAETKLTVDCQEGGDEPCTVNPLQTGGPGLCQVGSGNQCDLTLAEPLCKPEAVLGSNCTTMEDCSPAPFSDVLWRSSFGCYNGTCQYDWEAPSTPGCRRKGDMCEMDMDCVYGLCDEETKTCVGKLTNSITPCMDGECAAGMRCVLKEATLPDKYCIPLKEDGETITNAAKAKGCASGVMNEDGLSCQKVEWLSVAENKECWLDPIEVRTWMCAPGLYCNENLVCAQVAAIPCTVFGASCGDPQDMLNSGICLCGSDGVLECHTTTRLYSENICRDEVKEYLDANLALMHECQAVENVLGMGNCPSDGFVNPMWRHGCRANSGIECAMANLEKCRRGWYERAASPSFTNSLDNLCGMDTSFSTKEYCLSAQGSAASLLSPSHFPLVASLLLSLLPLLR